MQTRAMTTFREMFVRRVTSGYDVGEAYVLALAASTSEANLGFVQDVNDGLDLSSLPRTDCIEAHLPADRTPTEAEVRAAWNACVG